MTYRLSKSVHQYNLYARRSDNKRKARQRKNPCCSKLGISPDHPRRIEITFRILVVLRGSCKFPVSSKLVNWFPICASRNSQIFPMAFGLHKSLQPRTTVQQVAQLSQRDRATHDDFDSQNCEVEFLSHPFGGLNQGKRRCFMCTSLEEAWSTSYR